MAAVAVSQHATGPFEFVRSFYPDGNETHDQVVFLAEDQTTALLSKKTTAFPLGVWSMSTLLVILVQLIARTAGPQ